MAAGTRTDPYGQFNFEVEINSVGTFGFSEVSGLTTDTNIIEYRRAMRLRTGNRRHASFPG